MSKTKIKLFIKLLSSILMHGQIQLRLLEQNKRELQLITKSTNYHGMVLSPQQMENIAKRMNELAVRSENIMCRIEYEETRQTLQSLTEELEAKLKIWNQDKYGSQQDVKTLYIDFQVIIGLLIIVKKIT